MCEKSCQVVNQERLSGVRTARRSPLKCNVLVSTGLSGLVTCLLLLCLASEVSSVRAQDGDVSNTSDVFAAAQMFERGQREQVAGNFSEAARLFELADSVAPSAEALRS